MLYRSSLAVATIVTAFCATIFDAQAWDDSKYPDLKGEWRRVAVPSGRLSQPGQTPTIYGASVATFSRKV